MQPALDAYDVEAARADFPILAERPYGKPLVYLDNAASAQKPKQVIDRLTHAYEHEYANVHRGLHYLANAATEAYEAARETVRRFVNAASHEEIVFTRSATEAINLVASSFGLAHIGAGDEIVLSVMEHHSNVVPWHFHRERKGAVLRWVDVGDDGSFSLDAFERALSDRTKIVAITQMSNVLGTAVPIKELIKTEAHWDDYLRALDYRFTAEDEALIDRLVAPGHPSTPGYNDPAYPIEGRRAKTAV